MTPKSSVPSTPAFLASLALLIVVAWPARAQPKPQAGASALKVEVSLRRSEVLVGESVGLGTQITNTGTQEIEIQSAPAPLVYRLHGPRRGTEMGPVLFRLSRGAGHGHSGGGQESVPDRPRIEPRFKKLGAGETFKGFGDDLRELSGPDIPAADYELVVEYRGKGGVAESSPVPLRIRPLRVVAIASRVCPLTGHVATALAHWGGEAGTAVLQLESWTAEPNNGRFQRHHTLAPPDRPSALVLAMHTATKDEGRWVAWLRDGRLEGLKGWGSALNALARPQTLDLKNPRLVRPGFQLPDQSGRFLVAGTRDGATQLQAWRLVHGAATLEASLNLEGLPPGRLLAWSPLKGTGEMHLVWAERAGELHRIRSLAWDVARGGEPKPRVLFELKAPLRALELTPVSYRSEPRVHALFGSLRGSAKAPLVYVRLGLGADPKPAQTRFEPPRDGAGKPLPVASWAITAAPKDRGQPVLARVGGRTLWTQAAKAGSWAPVNLPKAARNVKLLDCGDGGLWATCLDPDAGLRHVVLIPDRYAREREIEGEQRRE